MISLHPVLEVIRRPLPQAVASALLLLTVSATAAEGPVISTVRVESIGPVDEAAIIDVLELQAGSRLDRKRLREVIMTLYAGGDVEWLRVEAAETADGLDVVIHVSRRSRISQVDVHTKSPILKVKIHRWLQLEPGEPVTVARIEAGRRRVERRLHDRGYADASVEAYLDFNRKANTVAVEIDVQTGKPQVVGSVMFDGPIDEKDAAAALPKVKTGARLTRRLEDRLRDRAEQDLRRMGFWEAEVVAVTRHTEGSTVTLHLQVEPGPRYRLELETAAANRKAVENALPDPAKEELHPAQTEALAELVEERLQASGYLLADVTAELLTDDGEQVLHLTVDPGRKLKIAAVEFPGADNVSHRKLEETVHVKKGGVGGRFQQSVDNRTLESDRAAIENLYRNQGFPFAVVAPPQVTPVEGEDAVTVGFPVTEGDRWSVVAVRVEGLPVETAAELEARPLEVTEGAPWSPDAVDRDVRRIEEALADTGYPEGAVESAVDTSRPGKASVIFRVEAGPFVRIGDVIISGLRRTREKLVAAVVRRAGVRTGEPLSRRNMLDAQRGLFELGLFRRVELVPMPGQEHRAERNIVVRCEEGEQKSYLFGVGYSDRDAARVILGWSHLNLLGRAYAFAAEVSLSRSQQRYSLSLRKRRFIGLDLPAYLAIYRTDEVLADRDLLRRGLWIDFGDRLKRPLRPWFRYEYEIIQPESFRADLEPLVTDEFQETKVASITPSVEWDTRDNPLAPKHGVFASASLQYAFPAFQADAHFLKFQTGATVYGKIWRGLGAAGLRLGVIDPIGAAPDLPENLQIPFAYRFFAGGRTTHRAFATDNLGIPGQTIIDGNAVGGNAVILLNLEYRRRIAGELYAAIFLDAGNVWAAPSKIRVGDIRWGPGIGLNYVTPAGPLRAEYAWKLNPEPGESGGQFFISFGVPF